MCQFVNEGEWTSRFSVVVIDDDKRHQPIGQGQTSKHVLADVRMVRPDIAKKQDVDPCPFSSRAQERKQLRRTLAPPLLILGNA